MCKHLPSLTRTSSSNYCIMYSILVEKQTNTFCVHLRVRTYSHSQTIVSFVNIIHLCHVPFSFWQGMNMKKDRKKNRKLFKSHEKYFCLRYVAYVPRDDSLHVFAYVFLLCVTWKWMAFCIFIIIIILARGNHIVKPIRFA